MKHHLHFRIITVLTVIILSLFSQSANAQAKGSALVTTAVTIQTAESVEVGGSSEVLVQLTSSIGQPISDQPIEFWMDGVLERRGRTDATGSVSIKIKRDVVGTYALTAIFKGSPLLALATSKATTELVVVPAIIEIQTIPPLPNIKFSLDNQVFSSNAEGIARIEVEKGGMYRLELLTSEFADTNMQMEFSRWADDTFVPYRDIEVPLGKPLQVGFEVSYQVSHTFVDRAGEPVDPARITSVTIKGSNGTTYTFEDNQPHWLLAGRVIRLNNGLEQTKILYSVIDVTIDGSNVVSKAQQRFYIEPNDVWSLKLLLYSARFFAVDALFRFPIGSGIEMEYPNGNVQTFLFDSTEEHFSQGLARGIYHVTVIGARGIAPPTPMALSRDQDVELLVLSYFDLGVMFSLGLSLALGLLYFGRPKIFIDLAAIPNRVVSVLRKKGLQPAGTLPYQASLLTLRTRLLATKRTFQIEMMPQFLRRLNLLQISLMPKHWATQVENSREAVLPYYLGRKETASQTVARPALVDVMRSAAVPAQVENLHPNEVAVMALDQVNDLMPMGTISAGEQQAEVSSPAVPTVEAAVPLPAPHVAESVQSADQSEGMRASRTEEISTSAATEIVPACQACGSLELVKHGTNRRGQQQYRCKTCGTSNVFGSEPARKRRRKKSVVNLS